MYDCNIDFSKISLNFTIEYKNDYSHLFEEQQK